MGFFMINALSNHCGVWSWKNYENRSTFAEVMGKNISGLFFWTVYFRASKTGVFCNIFLSGYTAQIPWAPCVGYYIRELRRVLHLGAQTPHAVFCGGGGKIWSCTRSSLSVVLCKTCFLCLRQLRRVCRSLYNNESVKTLVHVFNHVLQASSQGPPVSAVVYAGRWAQHRSSGAVVTV